MAEFRMPSLGADMDRGTLLEWKVAPGDTVAKGDIVAVIDTEKSDIEVEIFHGGTVQELLVAEGEEVEVGTVLALLSEPDGATTPAAPVETPRAAATTPEPAPTEPMVHSPIIRHLADESGVDLATVTGSGPGGEITRADVQAAAARTVPPPAPAPAPSPAPAPAQTPAPPPRDAALRSSPLARKRATELGIDLASIIGTGPNGAITLADVESATQGGIDSPTVEVPATASEPPPTAEPVERDRTGATRLATGRLMARSKREIPHYYLSTTIDMASAMEWLEAANRDRPITERLLPAALLLKAVAIAASSETRLNGWWIDEELRSANQVDLGVGVSLRAGGLIAPVIPDASAIELDELMAALRGIVSRARAGKLTGSDLQNPSITVTNLGDQSVESVYGVIAPPQVAVVGFGGIVERPWAVDGMLTVRPVVTATLSADHRATDGHEGARFLATIDRLLQNPESL